MGIALSAVTVRLNKAALAESAAAAAKRPSSIIIGTHYRIKKLDTTLKGGEAGVDRRRASLAMIRSA